MKRILALIVALLALTACSPHQAPVVVPAATGTPQAHMPNPASVYCAQQGNRLEIRTAADGSQTGICVSTDGSTCDEWAYYREECGPAPRPSPTPAINPATSTPAGEDDPSSSLPTETTEEVADWWGVIKTWGAGAQFDDYFERQDLGQIIIFGIDSLDPAIQSQIVALRDTGKTVHLYGTFLSNVPDSNGSQIQVERLEAAE
jgi:putative hemolysin